MNVVIIDGLNLIRRVHAAVLSGNRDADETTIINSCTGSLRKLLQRTTPSHVMCVMDSDQQSWRHHEYPPYKANRKPMDETLKAQLPAVLQAFEQVGVKNLAQDGFEADDVIASIAARVAGANGEATIVSTDKSFCQMIRPGIRVYDHFNDRYLDKQYVKKKFETTPELLPSLFGLAGDSGLNVPGVRSIGIHTAAKLVNDHGDIEQILKAAEQMPGHVGEKLRAGKEEARQATRLLALRTDADLGLNIKDFRYGT